MSDDESDEYDPNFEKRQIAWQFGCAVSLIQPGVVLKQGAKVRPSEERAMRLVQEHTPQVPTPRVHGWRYKYQDDAPYYGELYMDFMPGRTLKSVWAELNEACKDRVCQDIWDLVAQIRTIPRPHDLGPGLYRTVDGSPSRDPLLGSSDDVSPRNLDDDTLRDRIYSRYVASNGLSYRDNEDMPEILPRSNISVFAHGDIGPRNIIVDENYHITALLDWESSGWFPDYWEFAQMMKYCDPLEHEWQSWMDRTKPKPWDIRGIQKARRVLF
ncbi:hypothetical protein TOPH_08214 [Tolypocladium ophioglossoides CBS 100239]|uniref:Aminoglycoside phosphotransferase domain-containing protein n=1 Tax=Tolypocladium ophioglossoides (strain CBS 100239) TaxID=1163406 RepID=A0A0L0MZB9_TOLOC|nr:hypothetical protein TOPH_08214 [Tolypocladium ophioglossoides CBS 100239]